MKINFKIFRNKIVDLILTKLHAILVIMLNILLYFNENLYNFFLCDINNFFGIFSSLLFLLMKKN